MYKLKEKHVQGCEHGVHGIHGALGVHGLHGVHGVQREARMALCTWFTTSRSRFM